MTATVFVPRDAAAVSVGANDMAGAITRSAEQRRLHLRIVRNGSRGMFWLEPLVEVATPTGCVAHGAAIDYIYIRSEHPDAERTPRAAIAAARQAGFIGPSVLGSGKRFDLDVRRGHRRAGGQGPRRCAALRRCT